MTATWTKLRTGAWGARIVGGPVRRDMVVEVAKRDGTTSLQRVTGIVWSEGDVTLVAVAPAPAPADDVSATPSDAPERPAPKFIVETIRPADDFTPSDDVYAQWALMAADEGGF